MTLPTHITAKEIAPILGLTERSAQRKADRETWPFRARQGKGGGREYAIKDLPAPVRDAVRAHYMDAAVEAAPALPAVRQQTAVAVAEVKNLPSPASLKGWQRERMDARLAFLRLIEHAAPIVGVSKAITTIVEKAANGQLPSHLQALATVANARAGQDGNRSLSYRSLMRWWSDLKTACGNYAVLAPRDVEDHTPPVWAPAFMSAWRSPQKHTLADTVHALNAQGVNISYHQAARYLGKLGEVEKNRGRMGSKELANIRPFRRRDTSNLLPGDVYTADGHTFDAEVAHPYHGKPFRPEITLILDVATRMPVGWSVSLAESAIAVVDALRHACETHGIPAIFYTDNGPGYRAELLTVEGTGLLSRLGITAENSIPGRSQSRGIIERGIQTVLVKAAKALPTYIGKPMDREAKQLAYKATRKEAKARGKGEVVKFERRMLPTWSEFIAIVEASLVEYCDRHHRGLPRFRDPVTGSFRHYSPNEMWQRAVAEGWQPVMPEGAEDMYHPQEIRRVVRGEVRLWNNIYASADLAEYHGKEVVVSYDIHDPSLIWVRQLDGRIITRAKLDGSSSDYFPLSKVEQDREKRADGRRKRLERQIEEIEMERKGPALTVLPERIEITPEQFAKSEKVLSVLKPRKIMNSPFDVYLDILERKKANDATGYEIEWASDYERSTETGRKIGLYKADEFCRKGGDAGLIMEAAAS